MSNCLCPTICVSQSRCLGLCVSVSLSLSLFHCFIISLSLSHYLKVEKALATALKHTQCPQQLKDENTELKAQLQSIEKACNETAKLHAQIKAADQKADSAAAQVDAAAAQIDALQQQLRDVEANVTEQQQARAKGVAELKQAHDKLAELQSAHQRQEEALDRLQQVQLEQPPAIQVAPPAAPAQDHAENNECKHELVAAQKTLALKEAELEALQRSNKGLQSRHDTEVPMPRTDSLCALTLSLKRYEHIGRR